MSTEAKPEAKQVKLVKVRAKRPIADWQGRIIQPGEVGEVSEEMAADFCKPSKGHHTFGGERWGAEADNARADLTRAERVPA